MRHNLPSVPLFLPHLRIILWATFICFQSIQKSNLFHSRTFWLQCTCPSSPATCLSSPATSFCSSSNWKCPAPLESQFERLKMLFVLWSMESFRYRGDHQCPKDFSLVGWLAEFVQRHVNFSGLFNTEI